MQLINYSIVLNIIFFVNIKAEVIRAACNRGGQQCYFDETCCSKKCIHGLNSKYFGGICAEDKVELIEPGINGDNATLCLPIGAKCLHKMECCSNNCYNVCEYQISPEYMLATRKLYPDYCLTVGKPCFNNSDCCSSRCIPGQKKRRFVCDSDNKETLPSILRSYEITERELRADICRSPGQDCYMDMDCCFSRCKRYDSKMSFNAFCDVRRSSA